MGDWERHVKSWDLVAGAAIVLAAGGQVSARMAVHSSPKPEALSPVTDESTKLRWTSCAGWQSDGSGSVCFLGGRPARNRMPAQFGG